MAGKPWERYGAPAAAPTTEAPSSAPANTASVPPWMRYKTQAVKDAAEKKRQRILDIGAKMPDLSAETSGPPTMEGSRVTQAFEAAADPSANQPFPLPRGSEYGFSQNMLSRLPFGDETAALGGGIGRYLAGKSGLNTDIPFTEAWNYGQAINRAGQEQYRGEHPWGDTVGQALGIATTGPTGAAEAFGPLKLVQAAGPKEAANVAKTFLPTKGSIGRLGQATLAGEVMGGLSGAGEGEGLQERGFNALEGTLGGGLTGLGASPVLEGAGLGLRSLLASPKAAIGNRWAPQNRATAITEEALRRDQVPIAEAASRLRAGGPEMVLADVGGANVRGLARTAVNTPGAARERITKFVEERNLKQPQRIVDVVTSVLRNPADFGRTTARMAAEREKIASPLYKQAFAKKQPVNVNDVVRHIDKIVKPGGISAMADLRPDGITATMTKLRGYFQTAKSQRVGLEQLHRVKTEIDDGISSALRSGDNNKAREMLGVQRELLKAMDRASPDYAKARGIYSSSHETERALEIGRNAFKMTADDMQEALRGMTQGEKEMVQVGLARAVQDQVESRGFGSNTLKTVFKSPQIMKTLRTAFQDEPAFRRFQSTLIKEGRMSRTAEAVRGNSTTAAQAADLLDFQKGVGPDVITQFLQGQPVKAAATALRQSILGEKGINEKVADKIADMLLSNDPKRLQRAMQLLNMRQGAVQRIAARMSAIQKLGSNEIYGAGPDVARQTPVIRNLPFIRNSASQ